MSTTDVNSAPDDTVDGERRDFIHLVAAGMAVTTGAAIVVPLVGQLAPGADVKALATTEVNIGQIEPGQAIKAIWQGKPVFLRRLTESEVAKEAEVRLNQLKDKDARNDNDPGADATEAARLVSPADDASKQFVVVLGVCTHLGCVPLGTSEGENKGEYGGWFCPCHGSHYDALGRIRKGPAPENLAVPPVEFLTADTVRLG